MIASHESSWPMPGRSSSRVTALSVHAALYFSSTNFLNAASVSSDSYSSEPENIEIFSGGDFSSATRFDDRKIAAVAKSVAIFMGRMPLVSNTRRGYGGEPSVLPLALQTLSPTAMRQ